MKVTTISEMREMDKRAITEFGIKEILLMENAGESVYYLIREKIGIEGKKFLFFCGSGNNGGDGFVAARKIYTSGGKVKIFTFSPLKKFKGSARTNSLIARKIGIEINKIKNIKEVEKAILHSDVIVDGIFGTGLSRDIGGIYKEVIDIINNSGKTVVSIDIPSGINGNTGEIMGISIESDFTITFGLPKIGNLFYPGAGKTKKLFVTHISFPKEIYKDKKIKLEINIPSKLPEREEDSHKGTFGDVLFLAGCNNYFGAPFLSSYSFLKAGGGYSRLATVKSVVESVSTRGSEIVFHPMEETNSGSISSSNFDSLLKLSKKVDFVVMGPGISTDRDTKKLVLKLLKHIHKPVLIDGDGLTAIKDDLKILKNLKVTPILTPHIGEMARLTTYDKEKIKKDKLNVLREFTGEYNSIVVLKGKNSLIGFPDGRVFINTSGNSGLSVAGSGDVLTGCISAMYGLGLNLEDSVMTGVFLHGYAADLLIDEIGKDGMLPTDVLNMLPKAVKNLRENYEKVISNYIPEVI